MKISKPIAALLAATAALSIAAAPPTNFTAEDGHVALVLERTTDGPNSFDLDVVTSRVTGEENFIGLVGLEGHGEALAVHPALMAFGSGEPVAEAHVLGTRVGCPTQGCGAINLFGALRATASYDSANGGPDIDRFLVLVETQTDVDVELEANGWTMRAIALPFDTVRHDDVNGAASVYAAGEGYEVFTSASKATDLPQSIALADMPCSGAAGTAFGPSVGTVTLTGGRAAVEGECIAESSAPLGAVADAPTTWSLDGIAAGSTAQFETRLAIAGVPAVPSCEDSAWIFCAE